MNLCHQWSPAVHVTQLSFFSLSLALSFLLFSTLNRGSSGAIFEYSLSLSLSYSVVPTVAYTRHPLFMPTSTFSIGNPEREREREREYTFRLFFLVNDWRILFAFSFAVCCEFSSLLGFFFYKRNTLQLLLWIQGKRIKERIKKNTLNTHRHILEERKEGKKPHSISSFVNHQRMNWQITWTMNDGTGI